jgi:hypothetical protein
MAGDKQAITQELVELSLAGLQLLPELAAQSPELMKGLADELEKRSSEGQPGSKAQGKAKKKATAKPKAKEGSFGSQYQRWYSQALRVVEQLLPDRYDEFRELYRLDKKKSGVLDIGSYRISDYMQGRRVTRLGADAFDAAGVALSQLMLQLNILESATDRPDSALADIRGTLEAGLLDDELDTAQELLKAKHLRSAGVVAGVVLERHLKRIVSNHEIIFRKKAQIANLNNALKEAGIYDLPQWRFIERLGDIRNICGHDKERDPTAEEVEDLIRGTEKVVATVF